MTTGEAGLSKNLNVVVFFGQSSLDRKKNQVLSLAGHTGLQ